MILAIYAGLLYIVLSALTTALASAAHGGDSYGKYRIIAVHALIVPLTAAIFWFVFRRGRQAKAELDYIDGRGTLSTVRAAYPLGIGRLVAPVIAWSTEHPWPRVEGQRGPQEMTVGAVLGAILGVPVAVLIVIFTTQLFN